LALCGTLIAVKGNEPMKAAILHRLRGLDRIEIVEAFRYQARAAHFGTIVVEW
jgi:hypothetical protein